MPPINPQQFKPSKAIAFELLHADLRTSLEIEKELKGEGPEPMAKNPHLQLWAASYLKEQYGPSSNAAAAAKKYTEAGDYMLGIGKEGNFEDYIRGQLMVYEARALYLEGQKKGHDEELTFARESQQWFAALLSGLKKLAKGSKSLTIPESAIINRADWVLSALEKEFVSTQNTFKAELRTSPEGSDASQDAINNYFRVRKRERVFETRIKPLFAELNAALEREHGKSEPGRQ